MPQLTITIEVSGGGACSDMLSDAAGNLDQVQLGVAAHPGACPVCIANAASPKPAWPPVPGCRGKMKCRCTVVPEFRD